MTSPSTSHPIYSSVLMTAPLQCAISISSAMVTNFWSVLLLLCLYDLIPWEIAWRLISSSVSSTSCPDALILLSSTLWFSSFVQPFVPPISLLLLLAMPRQRGKSKRGTQCYQPYDAWPSIRLRWTPTFKLHHLVLD
jgi:hypothetical protein